MSQSAAQAAFSISYPTSNWQTAFAGGQSDISGDQRTGPGESDLIGDASHPVLYWHFDQGSSVTHTDGTFYFRARMGGKRTAGTAWGFADVMTIGLDFASPTYGQMDLLLVSSSRNAGHTTIYGVGTTANTNPNTTSVGTQLGPTYAHDALNYNFQLVSSAIDNASPAPVVTDLDNNGATDGFVTFAIPFADIVAAAGTRGFTIDDMSQISFGLFTSTREDAINQDVSGIGAKKSGANDPWATSWTSISTTPIAPSAIPEPGFVMTALGVMVVGAGLRPRRRLAL